MAQNSMVYCGVKSPMVGYMAGDMVYSNIPPEIQKYGAWRMAIGVEMDMLGDQILKFRCASTMETAACFTKVSCL